MDRAYSALHVKELTEDKDFVYIKGIASTPTVDRMSDVVNPMGARFKTPMPLLWQHNHDMPVGHVTFAKPTAKGIPFEAQIPIIKEAGRLKERVDEAVQSLRYKLVAFVSIGFSAVSEAMERIANGGIQYNQWNWHELSLVTIPAQPEAVITSVKSIGTPDNPAQLTRDLIAHIKSIAAEEAAASGTQPPSRSTADPSATPPPGASGTQSKPAKSGFFYARTPEGNEMKTIAEQIAAFEESLKTKTERRLEIHNKAAGEGRTKDTAERTEFEELDRDIEEIKKELVDLRKMAEEIPAQRKAVDQPAGVPAAARLPVQVKEVEKLEPGIAMARYAMCLGLAKGDHAKAFRFAEQAYPKTENVVKLLKAQADGANLNQIIVSKATIPAGSTTDSTWAAPLVYAQNFGGDFINYLRARTLIGQAQFRPVPFNVRIAGQSSGGTAKWVGQGKAKPVTKFDFIAQTTGYTKVAGISVAAQELLRLSDPSAEALIRDALADCVIERIDSDLFDPDIAAVANVNPAGLLNGVSPIAGTIGDDAASIRAAILRLWAPWDTTFMGARPAYYTTPAVARYLASLREITGAVSFPGVGPMGGTLDSIPLRTSQYLANNGGSGGAPFILVDESEVYLADDGNVTLDASEQASVEMSDTPAGSSVATVAASATNFVSMWQTNSVAFRAERWVWWGLRRTGAIQWIDGFPTSA